MIRLYYYPGPNPAKVALFLEEAGLAYEVTPIDIRKGDQHHPDFVAINPNAKAPALTDGDAVIFDSNAILLYLADKTGRFLPPGGDVARGKLLSWLMFVATGIGPYSGQAVHFKTRETALCRQSLRLRDRAPLAGGGRPPSPQPLPSRRRLHHRRHGSVGMGARRAVHSGR